MDETEIVVSLPILILGWTVAVTTAIIEIPQLYRTLKTRNLDGVNIATQISWVASWGVWMYIALELEAAPKVTEEAIGLTVDSILLLAYLYAYRQRNTIGNTVMYLLRSCWILIPIPIIFFAGSLWGLVALTILLTIYDGFAVVPQMVESYRAPSLAGLSVTTWLLRVLLAIGGTIYAFGIGFPLLAGWGLILLPMSTFILIRIIRDRRIHGNTLGEPSKEADSTGTSLDSGPGEV